MKIGIAGLGVIGGSIAKALTEKAKNIEIYAFDVEKESIESALSLGVISKGSSVSPMLLKNCDIIFACMPVEKIAAFIKTLDSRTAVFTDVGSTKSGIMKSLPEDIRFVGGHPLTGSEKTGFAGSSATLFENAAYVLCKNDNTSENDFALVKKTVGLLGAIPLTMTAKHHDKTVAYISHIPHIAAAALVSSVSELQDSTAERLCAGGFKDITRIASSSPELWREILLSGGNAVIEALDAYIRKLEHIKNSLTAKDGEAVKQEFSKAKKFRDGISDNIGGMLPSIHEIWVDVPDKPGIIGTVATDLGNAGINIKNIAIQNNRDFDCGCLRIGLAAEQDAKKAVEHLTRKGYHVGRK